MKPLFIFENYNFLKVWLGRVVLLTGNHFSALVIPWIVLHETQSPLTTSVVTICTQIAPVCFALPAGTYIEKRNKKQVATISDFIRVVVMLIMIILAYYSLLSIYALALLLSVLGLAGLTYRISFSAMLPKLVGRQHLIHAHNYLEGAEAISLLIGPVLAGLVFSTYGLVYTLSIEAIAIAISLISFLFVTPTSRFGPSNIIEMRQGYQRGWRSFVAEVKQGFSYIIQNPLQRLMTICQVSLNFTTVFITLMIIIYAQQQLELSVVQVGLVMTGAGIGNLAGVFFLPRISHWQWHHLLAFTLSISGVGIGIIMLSESFAMVFLGAMLFDGGLSMAFVIHGSLTQTITSDHFLARVSSTRYVLSSVAAVLGTATAGIISEYISSTFALVFSMMLIGITIILIAFNKISKQPISELRPDEPNN